MSLRPLIVRYLPPPVPMTPIAPPIISVTRRHVKMTQECVAMFMTYAQRSTRRCVDVMERPMPANVRLKERMSTYSMMALAMDPPAPITRNAEALLSVPNLLVATLLAHVNRVLTSVSTWRAPCVDVMGRPIPTPVTLRGMGWW